MAADDRCFNPRAVVRALVPGEREDKRRICVVLRVEHDRVEVAYGQSTGSSSGKDLAIKKGDSRSKRYRVDKDTYFRPGNISLIPRSDIVEFLGWCTSDDLLIFQGFARAKSLAEAPPDRRDPTRPDGKQQQQVQQQQMASPDLKKN